MPIVLKLDKMFILRCLYSLSTTIIRFIKNCYNFLTDTYLWLDYDINMAIISCKSKQYGLPFTFLHPMYKSNSQFIDVALQNCIYNINVIDENEITEERINKMFIDHIDCYDLLIILQKYLTQERVDKAIKHSCKNIKDLPIQFMTREVVLTSVKSDGLLLEYSIFVLFESV